MALNDGFVYREQVPVRAGGRTLLAYLSGAYRHSTQEEWRACIARGEVQLDGVTADGTETLRPGQWILRHRPAWIEPDVPRTYAVIHQDEALLAVSKPSGLPTMAAGGYLQNTLLHLVNQRFGEARPLHRLGRATSGLVLFARTAAAAGILSRAFRERQVQKRYLALCSGAAAETSYEIRAPIGLVHHPRLGDVHGVVEGGKPAHSTATPLERRPQSTLFEVWIHTGRPEQIRIHLAFIGHPLVGDPLYREGGLPRLEQPGLPGDGGYLLHAERLCFNHPLTGEPLTLVAPLPDALRPQ